MALLCTGDPLLDKISLDDGTVSSSNSERESSRYPHQLFSSRNHTLDTVPLPGMRLSARPTAMLAVPRKHH